MQKRVLRYKIFRVFGVVLLMVSQSGVEYTVYTGITYIAMPKLAIVAYLKLQCIP